jgi:hyperosmotically inducible periplasmic protein
MKKVSTVFLSLVFLAAMAGFTSCKKKAKDADIKAAIETALKADPLAANTMVSVEKGVATISGECKDDACKTHCAELVKGIKGVKEVVNNCSVAPPPVVVNADDTALTQGLTDALKDHPGVKFSINEGKVVLTGEIAKAKWVAVKQMLDKLKPKGYDLAGLKIN